MHRENQPPLGWVDIEFNGALEVFAERNRLDPAKVRVHKKVLVLPCNAALHEKTPTVDVFPATAKEILTAFSGQGFEGELYGETSTRRELVRKTSDVLLPVLLFASSAAVSIGLNILGNWIYDRWVKRGSPLPSIRVEYAELMNDGRILRWRRLDGPVDQVCTLLRQEGQAGPLEPSQAVSGTATASGGDWWTSHSQSQARAALAVANELVSEGEHNLSEGNNEIAERLLRRALAKLREAVLWEPDKVEHRRHLHAMGERIHDQFGCQLEYREGYYWVNCPVMLSHSKGGFSVGGKGRTICTICGEDILNCSHVKGQAYDRVTARRIEGELCNICGERQCGHLVGSTYDNVRAFGVVVELDLDHVSFVENPSNPLAVVHRYSLTRSDLVSALPEDEQAGFEYGKTKIHCHHCKMCDGMG